ncbi:hypothetical protein YYG_05089 [Plasmodium vinckei petteri]|uniref:Uncharacterized protein n=1 Tax=Plasmodium vinckei petteri TaxID=138298 RepID=W7AWC9_PLAVN|nr:hypothetical protein YYG_05089 [Plasmodium vinckei petteri]CAD2099319.1 conserved rodent malaria protein, unknown function [Plasmodium vinckei petteri]
MLNEKDNDDDYNDSDFVSYFARKKAPKKKLTPFISFLKIVAGVFLCLMFKLFFKKPPPVPKPQVQRIYYYSTPTDDNLNFRDK